MKIKCPNCSADVEYIEGDCEICSECGNELKAAETPASANTGNLFANIDFDNIFKRNVSTEKVTAENWNLSERSKEIADNIENMEFDEHGFEPTYYWL